MGPASPKIADSDANGEGFRIPVDAALVDIELLDLDALSIELPDDADIREDG